VAARPATVVNGILEYRRPCRFASRCGGRVDGGGRRAQRSCRRWSGRGRPNGSHDEYRHHRAGTEHPGNAHPRSRTITARRIAVGTVWLARPTSSGSPRAPNTTGMTAASQAMRRAMLALIAPPSASDADPIRPCSTGSLTVTTTWGRSPPSVGSSPLLNARWASSTKASASRYAASRRSTSTSVTGRGAASGLNAERTISAASRSSHPASS
jgi:hypothetical protein